MAAEWFLTDGGGAPAWTLSDVVTPAVAAGAPGEVTAYAVGGTTLNITWTTGPGGLPDQFDVELESPIGSNNWFAATGASNPVAGGTLLFPASGLEVITGYTPRVRAKKTGFADSAWTVGSPVYTDNSGIGGGVIGAVDGTAPAYPNGSSIDITGITNDGYVATSPPATDAVGVAGYQWRLGGTGTWTDIPSGGRSRTFTGRTAASTDQLEMRARDPSGNFSDPLSTSVTMLGIAPAVTLQPVNTSVAAGNTATFIAGFSGTPTPTLQWYRNGVPVFGAVSATYAFSTVLGDSGAVFLCQATNSTGVVLSSNAAVLTVTESAIAPYIVTQPGTQTVYESASVTFSVVAAGSAPLAYQWRRNGVDIPGAISASYSRTAALIDVGAVFSVRVSNGAGNVVSNGATLTVLRIGSSSPFAAFHTVYVPDNSDPRTTLVLARSRGDTFADEFLIKSSVTGLPIDISGCTFLMTVDPEEAPLTDANNIFQLAGAVLDAPGGRVEFAPNALQTDRVGSFYFDIQMTDSLGRKRTLKYGSYVLKQDITKTL